MTDFVDSTAWARDVRGFTMPHPEPAHITIDTASPKPPAKSRPKKRVPQWEKHGITEADFEALIPADGRCPICHDAPEQWAVDHDHDCCPGRASCGLCVRGLLCLPCNWILAQFLTPERLHAAGHYLEGYATR